MTPEELRNAEGNVCKVMHGKRTSYYAPTDISPNGKILAYEVSKTGLIRRSKFGTIHENVINIGDIVEVLPVIAQKWS